MRNDKLEVFEKYNEQIFDVYKLEGLTDLSELENSNALNLVEVMRKKKALMRLPYSDFKVLDEFLSISRELKYVTGTLYFLRPYAIDTRYTGGKFFQDLPDRRYLIYANFGFQVIYSFWDRIGDLLNLYFHTGLKNKVYLGAVLNNFPVKYKTEKEFIELNDLYQKEVLPVFEKRHRSVHEFQLQTDFYHGNISSIGDNLAIQNINEFKFRIPELFKAQLDQFKKAFALTIKLISKLPDKFPFLLKKEMNNGNQGEFSISSIKSFSGQDFTMLFEVDKLYSMDMVEEMLANHLKVDKDLIDIYDDKDSK